MRAFTLIAIAAAASAWGSLASRGADGAPVRFNRDVRPILSDKCFHCHGPDAKNREADLRLDDRVAAVNAGAIVPGKPDESEMIARLLTDDKTDHMPPRKSKLGPLTPAEVATLQQWVREGAPYEKHWAFLPVEPAAPGVRLDGLVEKSLAAGGLALQPEADALTLLRRVSFDLTGLPPTPEEIRAFQADTAPGAYERVVERLLASPHYGERMAVDWLDVARYADSYGFQVDRERTVWPWRDWVVQAFNRNLPFDQFMTWQIAGDLLPHATPEQRLATTFNRLHQQEAEGGSVEEEYRVEYVADRVQTFSTAFLGLTFECARCHDHKFDPISQREYYQFFSLFQNIDEAGLYSFFTPAVPTPTAALATPEQHRKLVELERACGEKLARLKAVEAERRPVAAKWARQAEGKRLTIPGEVAGFGFEELLPGKKLANWIDPTKPAVLKGENKLVKGKVGQALLFTGDDPVDLPLGNFDRAQPFSFSLWLKTPDVKERAVVFHRSRAWTDAGSRGYELLLEDGKLKWSLIHFWPGNAISVRTADALPVNEWVHVVATYDGGSTGSGLNLYVNGQPARAVDVVKDALNREITGGGGDNIALGERFRDRGFKGGVVDEFRVFDRQVTALEALSLMDEAAARAALANRSNEAEEYYLATGDEPVRQARAELQAARREFYQAQEGVTEIMAMQELPEPKKAFILNRGQYDQRREEVTAGVPEWLLPWPAGAPHNRLGLAQWLTDRRHPLTARVLVNRLWQGVFGRGLVKTAEDFGSQSAKPVYPEVLDLLGAKFMEGGWDVKALLREIVTSRVYRQRSVADVKLMADDPENELLARGPRFRLSAEMIRDNALAAAGLLAPQLGGAPVNPYEMSEAFKPEKPSAGAGVYRRSLYTNWRRTAPPPAMVAFDAPRRAVCSAKRERTDSPLQALILLNGPQYVEAARVLGEKVHREAKGEVGAMIEGAFLRCLSRLPDAREKEIVTQLYEEQLAYYTAHPAEAAALLKIGQAPQNTEVPLPQAAAATIVAQTLMNHDASVVKR